MPAIDAVQLDVLCPGKNLKVFWAIIKRVSVLVMNHFAREKGPSNCVLNDDPVGWPFLAAVCDDYGRVVLYRPGSL